MLLKKEKIKILEKSIEKLNHILQESNYIELVYLLRK